VQTFTSNSDLIGEIQTLCLNRLTIRAASVEQDLFAAGLLDSMSLVQLILELEQRFKVELPLDELEIASFRSIREMAKLIVSRQLAAQNGQPRTALVNQSGWLNSVE
jgi:acyl carrier protein